MKNQDLLEELTKAKSERGILMSKKYTERKDGIKSVTLVIDAYNGRKLEIPLEVWQVDVIREMLGLSVDTTNLDTYCMRSKEQTDENMKIYHHLLRKYT